MHGAHGVNKSMVTDYFSPVSFQVLIINQVQRLHNVTSVAWENIINNVMFLAQSVYLFIDMGLVAIDKKNDRTFDTLHSLHKCPTKPLLICLSGYPTIRSSRWLAFWENCRRVGNKVKFLRLPGK